MANPLIHSKNSVARWGGKPEDYLPIHELLDSVKGCFNDNRARAITHNSFFAYQIIPKIFGYNIINSDGKSVDTVDIAMKHILEDFGNKFIPTVGDYLNCMRLESWMNNGVKNIKQDESSN